jgi:predicted house-cleaning noncanonical NTP pyrophosphatase (MazG superfamily)
MSTSDTDNNEQRYVVVTAISSHRMRYVIPERVLQSLREEGAAPLTDEALKNWAMDSIVMEEVNEFSQEHMGEYISDVAIENRETILNRFDEENDYLRSWSTDYKINWIEKTSEKILDKS